MTSIGDIVALLRSIIDRVDTTAGTAVRAQTEAEQAHSMYAKVAQGTAHPKIRTAITESRTAGEKAAKVARLLSQASTHLSNYINVIAPGAGPSRSTDAASPSGELLVQDADRAANGFRRFSKKVAQNAESAGDTAKKLTDFLEAARPQGTSSTTQRTEPSPNPTTPATPGDGAQALIITGATVLAAALNLASIRKKRKEQERGRPERLPRPDSGTGQG